MLKQTLIASCLSLTVLLMASEVALAQRGRGPSVGGMPGSMYRGVGPYRGGGYYGGSRYYGGITLGGFGYYAPLYYGGFYGAPYYHSPYYYPYSYVYPAAPYAVDFYRAPSSFVAPQPQPEPAVPANVARIRVLVPDADAKVFFDGAPTKQTGTERYFHTPQLDPKGGPYSYRIRASWKNENQEVIQERVVDVTPGKVAVADFR